MDTDVLRSMPVFGALSDDTIAFLLGLTATRRPVAGQFVVREGDEASCLYIVEAGTMSVLKGWGGEEVLLGRMRGGDCFGELALMDPGPRSASVRADTDGTLLELPLSALADLWERDVAQFTLLQMNLAREICRRLRRADERLFELSMLHVGRPPGVIG
jgi:CRP-like cAMP-binding protein